MNNCVYKHPYTFSSLVESTNPSLGDTLLVDIEKFLKEAEDKSNEVDNKSKVGHWFNYNIDKLVFYKVADNIFYDNNTEDDSETSTIMNDEVSYRKEEHCDVNQALQETNKAVLAGYNSTLYTQEVKIDSAGQCGTDNDEDTSYQATVLKLRIAGKCQKKS